MRSQCQQLQDHSYEQWVHKSEQYFIPRQHFLKKKKKREHYKHKYINASTYFSFLCFTANEQEIKTYHPVICGESNSYNLFSNEAKEPPRLEIFFKKKHTQKPNNNNNQNIKTRAKSWTVIKVNQTFSCLHTWLDHFPSQDWTLTHCCNTQQIIHSSVCLYKSPLSTIFTVLHSPDYSLSCLKKLKNTKLDF